MKDPNCGSLLPRNLIKRVVKMTQGNSTRPPTAKLMYILPANKQK
jgi:hypothetical protein